MRLRRYLMLLDENNGGNQGGGGTPPPAGNTGAPPDWRASLPDDIKADPALQIIQDIPSLAKSYLHAQKMVGSDKISVPSQHATEQDWQQVFRKLGVPEKVDDYKIERPKDASFDDEFVGQFKMKAHAFGILPKQAQNLVNWFNEASKFRAKVLAEGYAAEVEKGLGALKQEWGQAFDAKLSRANQVLVEAGGEELTKLLAETGLNNHPLVIKAFAKLGDIVKEDAIPADGGGVPTITPAEADAKIAEIFGNMDHPYHKPGHPGHKSAVEEMQQLFAAKFPEEKPQTTGKYPRTSA